MQSGDIVSYWDVVISPLVQEGKVVGIVDVTTDATERELALRRHKEALHNLQTQEERLALVLRATNDGIWDWNLITNEIYYSPRWKAMLGYLEQEIEPSVSAWQELVHPEDREEVLGKVEQHLLSEMDYFEYRNRLRHKDGDYRWVLTRGITLRSANGEPYRMVGANADVTEQVEAEQALSRQRAFENIITTISTRFINLDADEIDAGIHEALQTVAEYTDVDRSYLFQYDRGRMVMNCTHEWNAPHVEPQIDNLQDLPVDSLAWSNEVLLNGEVLHIPRVADLPAAAAAERVEFERQGIRSLIAVPLRYRNETIGLLGFDSVKQEKTWSPQIIALLRIVGEIFVNALENKRAQESLQQAYQTLELRVEQRTQEIERRRQVAEGLRDILSVLNSHRPLDKILDYIVERAAHFLNTPVVALYMQSSNSDLITIRASRGMEADLVANITLQAGEGTVGRTIQERRPVVIPDVNTIKIDLQAQQAPRGEADVVVNQAHKDALDHMRQAYQAVLAVPLMVRTEVSGALALYYPQPREFSPEDIDLALSFADQAALAIENARLQAAEQARLQESERRRRVAEGLREVLRLINTRQPLTEILNYIACQAAGLLHADATLIRRVDESGERVRSVAGWQVPPELEVIRETPYYHSDSDQALLAHQPVSIPDLRAAYTPEYLAGLDELSRAGLSAERDLFSSFLMVPIQLEKDIFGSLRFYFTAPRQLSDEEVNLGMILGEQAALAIENANLRAQAAEMAVLTERNRLARELHDAVTQTLFSASLMAEVLPRLWERNEAEGRRRLEELRQLTRGALAEMRTLLLELRPGHLVEADFSDLVRQLADAFNGRVRIPVDLMVKGKGKLPGEVQVAMYRIAQEALNNIAKHSQASQVEIALRIAPERVELLLADNGRGFDLQRLPADRLGLGIMRERAESIGAQYSIHSHPGSGTRVQVIWVQEERGEK